ncbi:MAG: chorismate synthase [Candidatus Wallbacteria bacterium]|nr:chorismate synthase [Candidatus Wallbacteria bacterium]
MNKIRLLTAGESHGPEICVIIDGLPAGLTLCASDIDRDLKRRQLGYGRGGRMKIESDLVTITAGVRHGLTTGAPVCLKIKNRDYEKWLDIMAVDGPARGEAVTAPRPGHADLAASQKYRLPDLRDVIERASARETAARVAAGGVFRKMLDALSISVGSQVLSIGGITAVGSRRATDEIEQAPLRCPDPDAETLMMQAIDHARDEGDTLGGVVEITASGMFPGLGSHTQFDRRLDAAFAAALMSIPSVKGVSIGPAFENTSLAGSLVHDEIFSDESGKIFRKTNRAGGIEGGISNGSDIVCRIAVKPIPTLGKPLNSIDISSGAEVKACRERADVCAVPAAGIVAEAMVMYVLADAVADKFGCDCMADMLTAHQAYIGRIRP